MKRDRELQELWWLWWLAVTAALSVAVLYWWFPWSPGESDIRYGRDFVRDRWNIPVRAEQEDR